MSKPARLPFAAGCGTMSARLALPALFPVGSMSGAKKLRMMTVIDEVETTPAGPLDAGHGRRGPSTAAVPPATSIALEDSPNSFSAAAPWIVQTAAGACASSRSPEIWPSGSTSLSQKALLLLQLRSHEPRRALPGSGGLLAILIAIGHRDQATCGSCKPQSLRLGCSSGLVKLLQATA
jgi:hypothetical protein